MRFIWGWATIFKCSLLIILTFFLLTCKKKESFKHVNISVHAASGLYNPSSLFIDNTSDAVNYALGFMDLDGVEVDIQLSSEGTLWMFHDASLEDRTDGNGAVLTSTNEYLESLEYSDLKATKLSKLSDVDWSLVNGNKNIYLDFKNLDGVNAIPGFNITDVIEIFDKISSVNNELKVFPIMSNDSLAEIAYNSGYDVFTDINSYSEGKDLTSTFYSGYFIRQKDITSEEVNDLQSSGKNVILFNIFSLTSVKKALSKAPYGVLVEDFKSAIIERN